MKMRRVESGFRGIVLAVLAASAFATFAARVAAENVDADVTEVRQYALTLDKAQKAAAAMQSINQLAAANPALNAAFNAASSSTGKKPITQQAQAIDSQFPQVTAIIRQNGLQTREFIVITGAIINDVGWVGMKKQGMVKDYPAGMITAGNATLIESNWDAFAQIAAKMTPPNSN
jgi:hypothetical protein